MALRIGINGAAGRMGQRLVALASADPQLAVAAALESENHPKLGADVGTLAGVGAMGVPLAAELNAAVDVMIDFSVPRATEAVVAACVAGHVPLVVATTGLQAEQQVAVRRAAETIPLLWAPSMSLAVNLAMKLAEVAGRALKDHPTGADVEIIERHHRFKEDAPSGTALKFGQIIAAAMGQREHRHGRSGRPGADPTAKSDITPSAPATTPASTRSSSACSARRSKSPSAPAAATAMPTARWPPRSFWPASRQDCMVWTTCWGCEEEASGSRLQLSKNGSSLLADSECLLLQSDALSDLKPEA